MTQTKHDTIQDQLYIRYDNIKTTNDTCMIRPRINTIRYKTNSPIQFYGHFQTLDVQMTV